MVHRLAPPHIYVGSPYPRHFQDTPRKPCRLRLSACYHRPKPKIRGAIPTISKSGISVSHVGITCRACQPPKFLQGFSSVLSLRTLEPRGSRALGLLRRNLVAFDDLNLPNIETDCKTFFQKSDKPLESNESLSVSWRNPSVFLIRSRVFLVGGIVPACMRAWSNPRLKWCLLLATECYVITSQENPCFHGFNNVELFGYPYVISMLPREIPKEYRD